MKNCLTKEEMATLYFLTNKQSEMFLHRQNRRRHYVASIKRHIDPESFKTATGLPTMVGVKDIWVNETSDYNHRHRLLSYNQKYRSQWGDTPLYGNVFVIVSNKVWDTLPADKKKTDDEVKRLTLSPQPTPPTTPPPPEPERLEVFGDISLI